MYISPPLVLPAHIFSYPLPYKHVIVFTGNEWTSPEICCITFISPVSGLSIFMPPPSVPNHILLLISFISRIILLLNSELFTV